MNRERLFFTRDEDLATICDRLNREPETIITIEIERGSPLYSGFGLRFIASKYPSKKFQIITSDPALKRIADMLSIRAYAKIDLIDFEEEYSRTHVLRHNFGFFEYFWYEIRKVFSRMLYALERRKKGGLKYKGKWLVETNLILLVSGLILSVSLLFFIFYFAVSKTFVTISPDFTIKTASANFLYSTADSSSVLDSRTIIPVERIEKVLSLEATYNISSYDVESVRAARGRVDLFNEMNNEQVFRPNTRFVTSEGLVFRSSEWIKIPPTRTQSGETIIGRTSATLLADGYDTRGELIGERGNIKEGSILDMPGLKFNRDKIYAKAVAGFTWGQNPTLKLLTEAEQARFVALLSERLKSESLVALQWVISAKSATANKEFKILEVPDNLKYSTPTIEVLDNAKIGDRRSDVRLKGSITIAAYVFDRTLTLSTLKGLLEDRLIYGTERLHDVLPETLKITSIVSRTDTPNFALKGTTELSATISYNFEDDANAQTRRLKNMITGKPVDQAISLLLNNQSIAKARIRLTPFWLTRVSGNIDNIEFIIDK
jgi:hypothetical protein